MSKLNKIYENVPDKIQEKALGAAAGALKKGSTKVGGKVGAALGHRDGGDIVGGIAGVAISGGLTKAPKEVTKATVGAISSASIKKGTQYAVTYTTRKATEATAEKAVVAAAVKVSAAKGGMAAATGGGGLAAFAGELIGGKCGEQLGKQWASKFNKSQAQAASIGHEVGALAGATGAGAGAGGLVGGVPGAVAGAAIGAGSYGIGKVASFVIDKAAVYEGVVLVKPTLAASQGRGTCDPEEAGACIITEEGIGKCRAYFYKTKELGEKTFGGMWCSRIMFAMEGGALGAEMKRGGWPWHQATILAAAKQLRGMAPPASSSTEDAVFRWTSAGVEAAKQNKVWQVLGCPEVDSLVSTKQTEILLSAGSTLEALRSCGQVEELERVYHIWTDKGVQAAKAASIWGLLDKPKTGDAVTQPQLDSFADGGLTLESLEREEYITPALPAGG